MDFNLEESLRAVIVSVTEVEDVVSKHPLIFKTAELVILIKLTLHMQLMSMPRNEKRYSFLKSGCVGYP